MSREQQQTLKTGSNSTGGNFVGSDNLKSKKIFVGGLPSTLADDEFRGYFQEFGSVTDVVIMYDSNTGRPRGFGFISFDTEDSVERVLQKTFHELNGKLVEVKRALPKDAVTGSASSRGGSRGFGSNFSDNKPYNSPLGSNRMVQSNQPTNGGYQPTQPTPGGYQPGSGGYPPYYALAMVMQEIATLATVVMVAMASVVMETPTPVILALPDLTDTYLRRTLIS